MPLFDFYVMVDWSGGARRKAGRSVAIWIAHGARTVDTPLTRSPHSRTEAISLIQSILTKAISSKRRVLLCFDFAYGYPVDFAAALQAATGRSERDLPWIIAWDYLSEHIKDDEGAALGAKPSNRSNRFEVANRINALLSPTPEAAGPFWCAAPDSPCPYIPQKRPPEPFQTAQGYLVKGLRLTDKRARSGSPFRLFGTASVGSQSLHAEIYPSVREPLPDEIKDRGQVRAMWQWARDSDRDNLLWREFCRPIEVETASKEDLAIQLTEGWILGCSPTITNQ